MRYLLLSTDTLPMFRGAARMRLCLSASLKRYRWAGSKAFHASSTCPAESSLCRLYAALKGKRCVGYLSGRATTLSSSRMSGAGPLTACLVLSARSPC